MRDTGAVVDALFLGSDGRNAYAEDGVTPLAPYPAMLNKHLATIQAQVILAHNRAIKRMSSPEVYAWLSSAKGQLAETRNIYYEPAHTWVDPSGYTLSRRIWRTSQQTGLRVDAMLSDGIRNGTGSLRLSRMLEQFLLPTRANFRTRKPYGVNASFDAMRLARTEIALAHTRASYEASRRNPYVTGIDFALSSTHPEYDICDELATIGMDGQRLREPYPVDRAKLPIIDTHPQCKCVTMPYAEPQEIIPEGEPPLTPAAPNTMLLQMLGSVLMAYISRDVQQELMEDEWETQPYM